MSNLRKLALAGVILLGGFAALGLLLILWVTRIRPLTTDGSGSPAFSIVSLSLAPPEGTFQSGQAIRLETHAVGDDPFEALELWVNGYPAGSIMGPEGGLTPWTTIFSWTPAAPGVYLLNVSARTIYQGTVYSQPLELVIGGSELAFLRPQDLTASPPAPPQTGPIASERIGDGKPGGSSLAGWVGGLINQAPPDAPELVIEVDGCSAILLIKDRSSNEETFAIHRHTSTAPGWVQIATLQAQSAYDWLTFTDSGIAGIATYFVESRNRTGRASSGLAAATLPEDCWPPESEIAGLQLRFESLEWKPGVDKAYCYASVNGSVWERVPDIGFLPVGEADFDLAGLEQFFVLSGAEGESFFSPMELHLQCWGWQGEALQLFGEFSRKDLSPDTAGQYEFTSGDMRGTLGLRVLTIPEALRLAQNQFSLQKAGSSAGGAGAAIPSLARFPRIEATLTHRREACVSHLEPAAQSEPAASAFCAPLPQYNEGPLGENPQPYIVWEFLDTCPAGIGTDCLPLSWWVNLAQKRNLPAYVEIQERFCYIDSGYGCHHSPYGERFVISETQRRAFRPFYRECNGDRHFRVRVVLPGFPLFNGEWSSVGAMVSPWSNWVHHVTCRQPIGDTVEIEITWEGIQLSNVDDCDLICENAVQTYGSLIVLNSSIPGLWQGREYGNGAAKNVGLYDPPGGGFTMRTLLNGWWGFATFHLCVQSRDIPGVECNPHGPNAAPFEAWALNNHRVRVIVRDGEALGFDVDINDYDEHSGDDDVCDGQTWTKPRTIQEWASTSGEAIFVHMPDNGTAECTVTIWIQMVP